MQQQLRFLENSTKHSDNKKELILEMSLELMCRAWKNNQILVAKFRFATAENELSEAFLVNW